MNLIDTHAHLDHVENLDEALKAAHESGVEAIMAISMDAASCRKNLEIKRSTKIPRIYLAMGMHPSEANPDGLKDVIDLIRAHKNDLCAIGEIGLDFWYKWVKKDPVKKEEQQKVFAALLDVAGELDLPVIIHARGAWRECLEMTKERRLSRAVFHWYSGPLDVLKDIMHEGYFVSASLSLKYSPQSRQAIAEADIKQILIETDSPVYYQISPEEGFKSQPKDVLRTLKAYCELKNMDEETAAKIFYDNARLFFKMS